MPKYLIAVAACAALLTFPAVAMTPSKTATHASRLTMHANANGHKSASHRHHRHMSAMNASMRGSKEVDALNALEAAGYRHFDNLHAQGTNFVATATKSGKSYAVTVTPQGSIQINHT